MSTSSPTFDAIHAIIREPCIFVFGIPIPAMGNGGIELALHHRRNTWFVVFPRAYGMAASRWVACLNNPRSTDPPSTAPPASLPHLNHRFWYNSTEIALDDLLKAKPMFTDTDQPLVKVTGLSRTEKQRGSGSQSQLDVEAKQVEVLISEDQLCRRCMYCGIWEVSGNTVRYTQVGQDGDDALHWCGVKCLFTLAQNTALISRRPPGL
jgi:hypothetical protein